MVIDDKYPTVVFGGGSFWTYDAIFQRVIGVTSYWPCYADGVGENPSFADCCEGE